MSRPYLLALYGFDYLLAWNEEADKAGISVWWMIEGESFKKYLAQYNASLTGRSKRAPTMVSGQIEFFLKRFVNSNPG